MKRHRSKSKNSLPPQMDPPLRRLSTPANGALLKNRRPNPKLKTELNIFNSEFNQMNPYMRTPSYLDIEYPPVIPPPISRSYSSSTGSSCSSVTYPSTKSSQSQLISPDSDYETDKMDEEQFTYPSTQGSESQLVSDDFRFETVKLDEEQLEVLSHMFKNGWIIMQVWDTEKMKPTQFQI
ncbi:hypothetical protein CRE_22311 [Caenorhabditis remanei]|uniref:Uncharacterized protein n=1 Tax=Caenorhabditis remanei TaxID=31234 RepID=E3ME19_CAERE|nr:hypothetical protein CRE_22311 [Caenorhabditis remanei]